MRHYWMLLVAMLLVVAACGGDSNGGAEDTGNASPTTQPAGDDGDQGSGDTSPPEDGGDSGDDDGAVGSGESTASVTIGGETYNFTTEGATVAQCLGDFFGVMSVQLPMLDDGGQQTGFLNLVALHEGTDPSVVEETTGLEVSIGDEDWIADGANDIYEFFPDAIQPGMSQVDSYEIVGRTVTGTATFIREFSLGSAEPEVVQGSFEATCGEDRTS